MISLEIQKEILSIAKCDIFNSPLPILEECKDPKSKQYRDKARAVQIKLKVKSNYLVIVLIS